MTEPGGNGAAPAAEDHPPLRLGGMALRNGLLIHGPRAWAVAARTPGGEIEVASGPKPVFGGRLREVPLFRGLLRLAEAFAVVPLARGRARSARLPIEDPGVIGAALAATLASGAARRLGRVGVVRESAVALLGALPALAALRDPDLAAYHGVEHKAIGAYEEGRTDPAAVPKEHDRCGSNLILPMLAFTVAGQVLVERLLPDAGRFARGLATVGAISAAVELFAYAERNPGSGVATLVHRSGREIQRRLSTREPTADQLDVGRAALHEVLRAEAEAADTL